MNINKIQIQKQRGKKERKVESKLLKTNECLAKNSQTILLVDDNDQNNQRERGCYVIRLKECYHSYFTKRSLDGQAIRE